MGRAHAPAVSGLVNRTFNWKGPLEVRQHSGIVTLTPRPSVAQVQALREKGYTVALYHSSAVVTR